MIKYLISKSVSVCKQSLFVDYIFHSENCHDLLFSTITRIRVRVPINSHGDARITSNSVKMESHFQLTGKFLIIYSYSNASESALAYIAYD